MLDLLLQMETAALKAASESRNKVFVRKVTAVYTPATLEAGVFEDSAADPGEDEDPADITPSYLFAVSERQAGGHQTGTSQYTVLAASFTLRIHVSCLTSCFTTCSAESGTTCTNDKVPSGHGCSEAAMNRCAATVVLLIQGVSRSLR